MAFPLFHCMYRYTVVQIMRHSSYALLSYVPVGHAETDDDRHQQTRAQKSILDSVILYAKMMNTCSTPILAKNQQNNHRELRTTTKSRKISYK